MISKYSDLEQQNLIDHCNSGYQYPSFTNQAGNSDVQEAVSGTKDSPHVVDGIKPANRKVSQQLVQGNPEEMFG